MPPIDRKLVESFLRINKLDAHAPVADIKGVFLEARWTTEEVETALMITEEIAKEKKEEPKQKKKNEKEDSSEECDDEEDDTKAKEKQGADHKKKDTTEKAEEKGERPLKSPAKRRHYWRSEYVGTDIVVDPQSFQISKVVRKREPVHFLRKMVMVTGTITLALMVAGAFGFILMYFLEIGPFFSYVEEIF